MESHWISRIRRERLWISNKGGGGGKKRHVNGENYSLVSDLPTATHTVMSPCSRPQNFKGNKRFYHNFRIIQLELTERGSQACKNEGNATSWSFLPTTGEQHNPCFLRERLVHTLSTIAEVKDHKNERENMIIIIYRQCNCPQRKTYRINKRLELIRGFHEVDRYEIHL